jgi:hypothetical protein
MREPGEGDATALVWGRRDKVSIFFLSGNTKTVNIGSSTDCGGVPSTCV